MSNFKNRFTEQMIEIPSENYVTAWVVKLIMIAFILLIKEPDLLDAIILVVHNYGLSLCQ